MTLKYARGMVVEKEIEMKSWKTFLYLFVGETELFTAGILLVTFATVMVTSQSIVQLLGTYVYFSRIILTILSSMAVGGIAIQISAVKRLVDDYVGYVFSTIAFISNTIALVLEIFEMISYGASWIGIEFFGAQSIASNSLLITFGFVIFGFSAILVLFSLIDLLDISFGDNKK
jgi:hypothetical protein